MKLASLQLTLDQAALQVVMLGYFSLQVARATGLQRGLGTLSTLLTRALNKLFCEWLALFYDLPNSLSSIIIFLFQLQVTVMPLTHHTCFSISLESSSKSRILRHRVSCVSVSFKRSSFWLLYISAPFPSVSFCTLPLNKSR